MQLFSQRGARVGGGGDGDGVVLGMSVASKLGICAQVSEHAKVQYQKGGRYPKRGGEERKSKGDHQNAKNTPTPK